MEYLCPLCNTADVTCAGICGDCLDRRFADCCEWCGSDCGIRVDVGPMKVCVGCVGDAEEFAADGLAGDLAEVAAS